MRIINYAETNGNRAAGRELNVNNVKIKSVAAKERPASTSLKDTDGGTAQRYGGSKEKGKDHHQTDKDSELQSTPWMVIQIFLAAQPIHGKKNTHRSDTTRRL